MNKKKHLLTDRSGLLAEKYAEEAAKALAEEIDAEILRSMMVSNGWHEVVLQPMTWENGYEIDSWVEENIKGDRWTRGLVWLFKQEKEAMWFKLRWLGSQQ